MKNFMGRTMAKMNDNRKKGRKALKGFTLVEIIVVLVILAILAAAMIPALTGYIDKAKDRTLIAEARNAVTAAQTLASEAYGLGKKINTDTGYKIEDMEGLAEVNGSIVAVRIEKGKVIGLVYKSGDTDAKYIVYKKSEGFGDPTTTEQTSNAIASEGTSSAVTYTKTTTTTPTPTPTP